MTQNEFIEWVSKNTNYDKLDNTRWVDLVDYSENISDHLYIHANCVSFEWENRYYGGTSHETDEYTFEDFIIKYELGSLKVR